MHLSAGRAVNLTSGDDYYYCGEVLHECSVLPSNCNFVWITKYFTRLGLTLPLKLYTTISTKNICDASGLVGIFDFAVCSFFNLI